MAAVETKASELFASRLSEAFGRFFLDCGSHSDVREEEENKPEGFDPLENMEIVFKRPPSIPPKPEKVPGGNVTCIKDLDECEKPSKNPSEVGAARERISARVSDILNNYVDTTPCTDSCSPCVATE
jgi:hypothetical protein